MRLIFALTILLAFSSCRSADPNSRPVEHLVFCWLNQPGNEAGRQRLIATAKELADLPGVLSVRAGTAVPSERPIVDASFDVGIAIRFDSVASMQAYLTHPRHQEAVKTVLKPLTRKVLVYDIVE
ncbi:MAG: hypothetical protein RL095_514 [Verrucomicrobiota bacterium]|jgi:hypothetical protein